MLASEDDTDRVNFEEAAARKAAPRGPKSEGALTVLRGPNPGFVYTLDDMEIVVGRTPDVQVSIPDDALSRRHACIRRSANGFYIEDLGSTNGTFIDGRRIRTPHELADGCRISLGGRTVLRFALHDAVEQQAARSTHELTVRDPLTQLYNRRHLEERLASEAAYAARHAAPLCVIAIDIDDFKQVNDTYGHGAGDAALRTLARTLGRMVRKEDVLARYGGEEFAILARGIDRNGATIFAERIRRAVEELRVKTARGPLRLTVSVGVVHVAGSKGCTAECLVEAADQALYAAKGAGKNRVEIAPLTAAARKRRATPTRTQN